MIKRGIGVGSFVAAGGGGTDADAQAFITAAAITDATQQSAINTLVVDLKAYGIWTKMKAIYPFVGGTASAHKFNLKDPRDLNAAFRLVFSGGWTHSSNGALPNGTNAFADTFLNPNSVLINNNNNLSFYSRTDTNGLFADMGAASSTSTTQIGIYLRLTGNCLADSGTFSESRITASTSNSLGFFNLTRTSTTSFKVFKNGSSIGSNSTTNTVSALPNFNLFLSAYSQAGSSVQYSNRQCAFASIGDGLTDTEAANYYTAVQAYQTTLSRNV
jgi:hypothetical protein